MTIDKVRNYKSGVDKLYWLLLIASRKCQMHVNMIISEPAVKIIKCNVNIAVCVLGLLFANTATVKVVTK